MLKVPFQPSTHADTKESNTNASATARQ